jgi:Short C-terminal domain
MPKYWDSEGNEIGFKAALKFQATNPIGYAQAQTRGRRAKRTGASISEVANSFRGIKITDDGRIESSQGGGSVAGARATVETSGTKAIASRRTMMRTVTPLAVLGQKKMESDTRQCFLVIEGQGWAVTESVPMDEEGAARAFAAKVNAAAAAAGSPGAPGAAPEGVDVTEQIAKLATLRDQGILTEDEFASKKAELLARM